MMQSSRILSLGKNAAKEGFKIKGQQLIHRSGQAIVLPQDNPQTIIEASKRIPGKTPRKWNSH